MLDYVRWMLSCLFWIPYAIVLEAAVSDYIEHKEDQETMHED